ncbi:putative acetyltransferase [Geomicrobium sp. JCM 19037]|uniref:GNAT family N-acetyltransferase n=1 Tax=Geomicrobium sp. JCM 19037 TaxID=1460634 RepID=UPI00045F1C55|nr:GNAT family N-acetyltransferase [Geomicrobium sp. JCM 19037]GAK03403.1 putative acetyltransferase [Geomicrobium sp. JCM 19037]
MIRLAQMEDLSGIVSIAKRAVTQMNDEGSDQWNDQYPTLKHFATDITNQELYVFVEERIEGFIVINQAFATEYDELTWTDFHKDAITLHRLAVNPDTRNRGVAAALFTYAEHVALERGHTSIKVDTYSLNTKAMRLFHKLGYTKVGELLTEARSEPFVYYEKTLGQADAVGL